MLEDNAATGTSRMLPLSSQQQAIFRTSGVLRLTRYIDVEYCKSLVDSMWTCIESQGIDRNDRRTWTFEGEPSHHFRKLKNPIKQIDRKGIQSLYTDDLQSKARLILATGVHRMSTHIWRITFPNITTNEPHWTVPRILWHTDCPRLAQVETPGIIVLSYLNDVEPCGGGTMVVSGSHRLYTTTEDNMPSKNFRRKLKQHTFFRTLFSKSEVRPNDLRGAFDTIHGVDVEVVELTGQTGDVVLLDARILHSISTNIRPRPRIMLRGFFGTKELDQSYQRRRVAA